MVRALVQRRFTPIALTCLVVAVLFWWFAWMVPESSSLATARSTQTTLEATRNGLVLRLDALRTNAKKAAQQESFLAQFRTAIPPEPDAAGLVVEVYNLTSRDDVKLSSITDDSVLPAAGYSTIPVSIDVSGTHNGVEAFIKGLYDIPRLLTIQSLTISGSTSRQQPRSSAATTATISATAYTLEVTQVAGGHD